RPSPSRRVFGSPVPVSGSSFRPGPQAVTTRCAWLLRNPGSSHLQRLEKRSLASRSPLAAWAVVDARTGGERHTQVSIAGGQAHDVGEPMVAVTLGNADRLSDRDMDERVIRAD